MIPFSCDAERPQDSTNAPSACREHTSPAETASERQQAAGDTASFAPAGPAHGGSPPPPAALLEHPRYLLLGLLGQGGMGTVYKARHRLMDRLVALKVVRGELVNRPEMVSRFEREVRAAALLVHPHIVAAYDAETYGPLHFLVMEYVEGINLADVIAREGRLPVARACEYVRQAAVGLQYAFTRGMVHRDIKPHNLIVTTPAGHGPPAEVVKIVDFGLARFIQETYQVGESVIQEASPPTLIGTGSGTILGTSNYIAPEQADDSRQADIRADIYSLGCTLYHLLTGRAPFAGVPEADRLDSHRHQAPRPIAEVRADVPPELGRVVARMLAKDPAQRYQTPAEVAEALAPFAAPAPRSFSWRRACTLAACLTLAVLLGVGVIALYRHLRPAPQGDRNETVPVVHVEQRRFQGHQGPVSGIALSRKGQLLLSGSFDKTLRSWDVASGQLLKEFRGHTGKVRGVALSADGSLALSASADRTVRVWDVATGKEMQLLKHTEKVTSVALAPDGKFALSGGDDGLRLWDVATGKQVRFRRSPAESVAFSPDGRLLAAGSDHGTISLWEVAGNKDADVRKGQELGVEAIAFSPLNGNRFVSGAEDGTLALWDVGNRTPVRQWPTHQHRFIWGVAFAPDGKRILSTGWDGTARLWDVASGRELQTFAPLMGEKEILCGAITPDGLHAVCGCADGLIRLWELPH